MNKLLGNLCLGLLAGCLVLTPLTAVSNEAADEDIESSSLPLQQLRIFAQVFGRIKKDYVEPVEDTVLLENAIKGMLSGLDPHSTYLDADDFKDLREGTSGEFGGLGIEIGSEDGFIKVISPIDDTPAQRAGVLAGDLITRIDDKPVKGMSLDESVKMMRGKPGTSIELTIMRKDQEKPLKISIVRDVIKIASVKGRVLDDRFAYLRISQFQAATAEDLLKQIEKLRKKLNGKIEGVVLDLRNNPGGVLQAAVAVSDAFLKQGLIVYTQGVAEDSRLEFSAEPEDMVDGAPLVVLVNEGSASASEIVAGALQDHKRAVIIGKQTFGKGSVQTIVPITDSVAIKLTTARYYTPSGRSIQAEGIKPDIELADLDIAGVKKADLERVKESDLVGHLEGDNENATEKSKPKEDKSLAETDYALSEAVNLLKGLALFNTGKEG
jgi:carboxyl-terminal processing protease